MAGAFEQAFAAAGKVLDDVMPVVKRFLDSLSMPVEDLQDYQMRRWLSQVPHGGIVGNKAVLIVYNEEHPSQSYLIVEEINS
jgi:hypothetical protein